MKNLIVSGIPTKYIDVGKGEIVLLLHGWGSDSSVFEQLIKTLKSKYRVIALDLPGFGGTQPPHIAWGVEDYSRFVAEFLDKMAIKQPYAIIGHSFGGRIILFALGNSIIKADKVVLLASHGLKEKTSLKQKLFKALAKIGKVFFAVMPKRIKDKLKDQLYRLAGTEDYFQNPQLKQTFLRVVRQDASKYAPNIKADALLLYGQNDKTTPPELGRGLANLIPGSKLEIIEDARHYLHTDKPKEVNKQIKDFLND